MAPQITSSIILKKLKRKIISEAMEKQIIYPGENKDVSYWTKKWSISRSELNEAILETGSLDVWRIKEYLKGKKRSFSLKGIVQFIKLYV
jgi:hypothetical protein